MTLSRREQVILTGFVLALLFGALIMAMSARLAAMDDLRLQLGKLRQESNAQRALIARAEEWKERYLKVKDQMQIFPMGMEVDTHWMSRMNALAQENNVTLLRFQRGKEVLQGDVYELSLESRECEATLEDFLGFLDAIHAEGAMLDVRELTMTPHPQRQGILKGRFTLYCAYMRGAEAPQ